MSASSTIGETIGSVTGTTPRFTTTTAYGMTDGGGKTITPTSCLYLAAGGIGTPGTGIQPGATIRTGGTRTMGPIYTGYATVTPDQVMVNVQVALRDWGYYARPIDGIIGTQSRAALAAFQADNGLAVTSAVDKPTLQTLGLA
jgi:Putative peptidoglycan binding domain